MRRFALIPAILGLAALLIPSPWTPAQADKPQAIDTSKDAVYRSGPWEYRFWITLPGTKSEGRHGRLFFEGREMAEPEDFNDYYETPWGKLYWVGRPVVLFGGHGWMPKPIPSKPVGKALPAPGLAAGEGPVVMMMEVGEGHPNPGQRALESWAAEEMKTLGAKNPAVRRDWFRLTDQAVTIHDTKMYGTLQARLALPRSADTLFVLIEGTESARIPLPRKDGAVRLIRRTIGERPGAGLNIYLAVRVDSAAPGFPKPFDIGAASDGKTVSIGNASWISINLPADKNSGCVWRVKSIEGDAVKARGEAQFLSDEAAPGYGRPGIFEQLFRVVGKGKTVVTMEYLRTWETDKPAEKLFRVTLTSE